MKGNKGGMKPSKKTIAFNKIPDIEIIKMLTEIGSKGIAIKYNLLQSFVSINLSRRNLFSIKTNNVNIKVQISKKCFSDQEDSYGYSHWINSEERISINQYKKL